MLKSSPPSWLTILCVLLEKHTISDRSTLNTHVGEALTNHAVKLVLDLCISDIQMFLPTILKRNLSAEQTGQTSHTILTDQTNDVE